MRASPVSAARQLRANFVPERRDGGDQRGVRRIAEANPDDPKLPLPEPAEIVVLGDDDRLRVHRPRCDRRVIGPFHAEVEDMIGVMAAPAYPGRQSRRQLGIDDESHSAARTGRTGWSDACEA